MSYKFVRYFRKLRDSTPISSYGADLFYLLLDEWNKAKWSVPFTVKTLDVLNETGMSRGTFIKAQKELKRVGAIDFQTAHNPKIGTKYWIILNVENDNSASEVVHHVNNLTKDSCTPREQEVVHHMNNSASEVVHHVNNLTKENPPTPPKENIYNINKPVEGEAAPAPTRTREGQNFIDNLKRDPLWQEEAMRACAGVEDSFDGLCLRVVQQWEAFGEDFNARDARKKFRNWLIKEAESLRRERLTQVSRPPIEERRKAFQMEIADVRSQRLDADNRPLYNVRICNDFFSYWTETAVDAPDVMRFEREAFWETSKRLAAWKEREKTRL